MRLSLSILPLSLVLSFGLQGDSPSSTQQALLNRYCTACHSEKLKTGGVVLEHADLNKIGENAAVWERVLRKMHTHQMPPPGLPKPTDAEATAFTQWLETSLDNAALANPNPGRTGPHRLNRAEYSNAIRDLLAVDVKPGSMLPVDDSGFGFDNIANLLSMSRRYWNGTCPPPAM